MTAPSEVLVQKLLFFESPHHLHLPMESGVRDALFEALIGDTAMTLTEARAALERWFLFAVFERFDGDMSGVCAALMMRGWMVAEEVKRLGEPPGYVHRPLGIGWEP